MNNEVINKLTKFAFITSIIGVCTLGICPAFGVMSIVVPYVFSSKGVRLNAENEKKCKTAKILGAISLFLFIVDVVIALIIDPFAK